MQGHKCGSGELWCKEVEKKEQKQQHIYRKENPILLKGCITTGVRNCAQKLSGRPDIDSTRNSLPFGRSTACRVSSW
ncbi:hypothetical protein TNCV_2398871 [Trichonephila clavipes]|uniref:Uncharacterized protein n=1 Tax=Trichonephila clavipes TaxID=2585209 RepID=A0A8X6SRI9_TRICX|nr:hypothetical protein TNCV_2398871 [Trichonephila clavipes]